MGPIGDTVPNLLSPRCKLLFNTDGKLGTSVLDVLIAKCKRAADITVETDQHILAGVVAVCIIVLRQEDVGTAGQPKMRYAKKIISEDLIPGRISMALAWMSDERRCPGAAAYCPQLYAYQRAQAAAAATARPARRE